MINKRTILFLLLSVVFASTHYIAMTASLYWYYWWFDVMMHFWGGLVVGLGVHTLAQFKWLPVRPTLMTMLLVLFLATIGWELFEWLAGLYDAQTDLADTAQDILLGFTGGLLTHTVLRTYTMK